MLLRSKGATVKHTSKAQSDSVGPLVYKEEWVATADNSVATAEELPATADNSAATAEESPATSNNWLATSEELPATADN